MTEELELELEVVTLVGGPAGGQDIEAPTGYLELWHCVPPGYCRYQRALPTQREMRFTGEALDSQEAMVEWLVERGYVGEHEGPILHVDEPVPRARRQRYTSNGDYHEQAPRG